MRVNLLPVLFYFLLYTGGSCFGQDSTTYRNVFPSGINLQMTTGYLVIRDEHISDERYNGSKSGFMFLFSRYHDTYGFRIGLSYEYGHNIKNYNVSAEIKEAYLNFNTSYPVGSLKILGNKVLMALGPGAGVYFYSRLQNIAQNQNDEQSAYKSLAWLFSLNGRFEAILPLNNTFHINGSLGIGIISFGGGTGNDLNNSTYVKLLTLLAGTYGDTEIGLWYYPWKNIALKAGYTLEIFRIDSWNNIVASSDNLSLSVGYHF